MSQSISLWGATYSDVPGVLLPKSTSGTALFTDVTDTTAVASDVASGKYFYTASGVRTAGTSSGGGGGGSTLQIVTAGCMSAANSYVAFQVLDEPTSFAAVYTGSTAISPSADQAIAAVVYDGSSLHAQKITNTNNAQVSYEDTDIDFHCSGNTLYITTEDLRFGDGSTAWRLVYTYGGSASNIVTEDVQVGSGATSITFTGLADEPKYWSCIFKSNFSTSSGYQRVIAVVNNGTEIYGLDMDSGAHYASVWTASYSNGSLTISSQGTNNGGYFHQPGYYQLTAAIEVDETLQQKTVTPSSSQQIVTADAPYVALSRVTVNAIPSSYVQPTTTVGATTYRASTSNQTINAGTYHSAAATIAAVSQTNLSAENIKSGTTVTISNGQNNLWSVTGTYSGGGGGGGDTKNVQVAQSTTRSTSTSGTSVISLTCSTAGTYDVYWTTFRSNTSGTWGSRLYIGGTAYETMNTSGWSNHVQNRHVANVSISANQTVAVYVQSRGSNYYGYVGTLTIVQA